MLFYLHNKGETIRKGTVLKAYELDVPDFGSSRKTLIVGDIIDIGGNLFEVYDYVYSNVHQKGIHIIQPYKMKYYTAIRQSEKDIIDFRKTKTNETVINKWRDVIDNS